MFVASEAAAARAPICCCFVSSRLRLVLHRYWDGQLTKYEMQMPHNRSPVRAGDILHFQYNFRDGTLDFCKEAGPESRRRQEAERLEAQQKASRAAAAAAAEAAAVKARAANMRKKGGLPTRRRRSTSATPIQSQAGSSRRTSRVGPLSASRSRPGTSSSSSSSSSKALAAVASEAPLSRKDFGQSFWGLRDKAWDYKKTNVYIDSASRDDGIPSATVHFCGDDDDDDDDEYDDEGSGVRVGGASAPRSSSATKLQQLYMSTASQRGYGPRGPIEFQWETCMKRLPFWERLHPVVCLPPNSAVSLIEPGEP